HGERQQQESKNGGGRRKDRAALPRRAARVQFHRVSPRSTRWNVPWIRNAAPSSSAESAAANGQSRNWRTCFSIKRPIVITRPPPKIAGVTKNPSAITKTSTLPAKAPGKVSGK